MNDKTKIMYNLARMYEYVNDALIICEQNNFNYEQVIENMVTKHAVNMCIVQLGEHAARIRDVDIDFYRNNELSLFQIKGMRDRITHSYGDVNYKIVKNVLKNDLPCLKEKIKEVVHPEIIRNPYVLYEQEYEEYVKEVEDPVQQCMKMMVEQSSKKNNIHEEER